MLVRMRKWVLIHDDNATKIRKISPFLLLALLIGYLLFGAGVFWVFENHQSTVHFNKFYIDLAVNRNNFAKEITQKIFNETKNLFVIMDLDQSKRVQEQLAHSLRKYEYQFDIPRPKKTEWNFQSSLAYAWSLLTTLGHSYQEPRTNIGQLFALVYTIIGVPLFVITLLLLAHKIVAYLWKKTLGHKKRKQLYIFAGILTIYLLFLLGFALFLYNSEIVDSFWRGINVAIYSAFTVHTAEYARFSEADRLLTQFASTISLLLGLITVYYGLLLYQNHEIATDKVASTTLPPTSALTTNDIPRFHVIVDEAGETKLQTAST